MIGFLKGEVAEISSESCIVLSGGVGYEVVYSGNLLPALEESKLKHKPMSFWIYTHVREDALQLFGFESRSQKDVFLSLLKVNGVGPKGALNIVSACDEARLVGLIEGGDVKGLSQLPKVGKKTAEQIVLTLKGKLVFAEDKTKVKTETDKSQASRELISALVNLGFRLQDVEKVVSDIPQTTTLEDGIRRGLSALTQI